MVGTDVYCGVLNPPSAERFLPKLKKTDFFSTPSATECGLTDGFECIFRKREACRSGNGIEFTVNFDSADKKRKRGGSSFTNSINTLGVKPYTAT